MTTRYIKIFFIAVLLFFSACSKKLDQEPKTVLTDQNFWNTTNDLLLACNYLYSFLPDIATKTEDVMSLDAFAQVGNPVSDGSWLPPAASDSWTNNYLLIRAANNIIEKSVKVQGDAAVINKYLGEAKFFRAWAYFDLVKRYGDVPLIQKTLLLSDPELYAPKTARELVLQAIYDDLDAATAVLPSAGEQKEEEYGRITSTAALAFKSRVALFEGTRQENFNYGDYHKHLQIAVDASQAVMTEGSRSLFTSQISADSSYYYLFQYEGEETSNPENILVRIYGENEVNDISANNYTRTQLSEGALTPTRAIADAYLYEDGLPMDKSPYAKPQTNTLTEFEHRDPRMKMSIFNKESFYIFGPYVPTFEYSQTGYKCAKSFIAKDWAPNVSYIDNIIIRYAEVLLNNIEAKFELNGSVSDEDLNTTINLIRARATMPALTNSFVTANGLNMQTEIRRERRIELAFEGLRYWDLLRWKTAETELPQAVLGAKYFPDEQGVLTDPDLTPEGFVIAQKATNRRFNTAKDYLWPIPTKELGLNINLTQNPGWQ
ncbi:MAG: RagB/SusD family nutrient uptake outer membrane protein [Agriterribacter sp.]